MFPLQSVDKPVLQLHNVGLPMVVAVDVAAPGSPLILYVPIHPPDASAELQAKSSLNVWAGAPIPDTTDRTPAT